MATYAIVVIAIVIAIWFYSIYSIISSNFKNDEEKKFWLIGVVLMPIFSLFYIFMKKDLIV